MYIHTHIIHQPRRTTFVRQYDAFPTRQAVLHAIRIAAPISLSSPSFVLYVSRPKTIRLDRVCIANKTRYCTVCMFHSPGENYMINISREFPRAVNRPPRYINRPNAALRRRIILLS